MDVVIRRSRSSQLLCAVIWVICTVGVGRQLLTSVASALTLLPFLALVSFGVWAVYWRPSLRVDDGGVRLVNVLRTIDLPWPAIQRIDTKWALTLFTAYGKFTAWVAPAPGIRSTARLGHARRSEVAESALAGDSIRPGDLPGSPSGDAAVLVRRRWEELRDAGHLDDPRLEFTAVPVRWHWEIIAVIAALLLWCLAAAMS